MVISFPNSPSTNDIHSQGALSWRWNGSSWLSVNAGVQGAQGTQGLQGIQGITGNQGVNGTQGTEGTQGTAGFVGSNGAQGSQGEQGIQGIQGIQGLQGTAGFVGSNGAQGTQGTQGIQGLQGTQGIQGLKGTKITPGDTAPGSPSENDLWWDSTNGILMVYYNDGTSSQWVSANSGIAGEQGIQGVQGITGSQGTQGIQGLQGVQGIQGVQGTQGVQGIQGITGLAFTIAKTYLSVAALTADTSPSGIVAGQFALINTSDVQNSENSRLYIWTGSAYTFVDDLSGSAGIQGITGSQGITGAQGITGTQGAVGAQGAQGTQGIQGIQGISGASILGTANTWTNTNAFTTLSATGAITSTATGDIFSSTAATTTEKFSRLNNTSGATKWGTESSVGGTIFTGTTSYASVFGSALNNPVQIASNNSVVGTFTSTGLGIGITPTQRLDVATASGDCIIRLGNGTSTARFAVDNDGPYIYALTSGDNSLKVFTPAGGTAMLIDTSGNVGIGTSSPAYKLSIIANNVTGGIFVQDSDAANPSPVIRVQGNRLDNNSSQSFSGGLVLERYNSNGSSGLVSGNTLGTIYFGGNYNTTPTYTYPASISAIADANWTSTSAASTALAFFTGSTGQALGTANVAFGTERMRINSSGQVGIGTSSPSQLLTFGNATAGLGVGWGDTTGNYANIFAPYSASGLVLATGFQGSRSSDAYTSSYGGSAMYRSGIRLNAFGNGNIQFFTDGSSTVASGTAFTPTERMRITDAGNVGIGTTSPSVKLDVVQTSNDVYIRSKSTTAGAWFVADSAADGYFGYILSANGTEKWRIGQTGGADSLDIMRSGTTVARIESSGKVLIQGGKLNLNNAAGGYAMRQCLTGTIAAGSSTVSKKIVYVGPTHALDITILAIQGGSVAHSAGWSGKIVTAYGASYTGGNVSGVSGNITAISVTYDNGGSPAYTLNVALTYTGAAPDIAYTIDGHSVYDLSAQ